MKSLVDQLAEALTDPYVFEWVEAHHEDAIRDKAGFIPVAMYGSWMPMQHEFGAVGNRRYLCL